MGARGSNNPPTTLENPGIAYDSKYLTTVVPWYPRGINSRNPFRYQNPWILCLRPVYKMAKNNAFSQHAASADSQPLIKNSFQPLVGWICRWQIRDTKGCLYIYWKKSIYINWPMKFKPMPCSRVYCTNSWEPQQSVLTRFNQLCMWSNMLHF